MKQGDVAFLSSVDRDLKDLANSFTFSIQFGGRIACNIYRRGVREVCVR